MTKSKNSIPPSKAQKFRNDSRYDVLGLLKTELFFSFLLFACIVVLLLLSLF